MTTEDFIKSTLEGVILSGGSLVSNDQYLDRISVCSGCPFKGEVTPLPLLTFNGCTKCGCPFSTKPKMKTYFSLKRLKMVKAECPEQKWESVDAKYL